MKRTVGTWMIIAIAAAGTAGCFHDDTTKHPAAEQDKPAKFSISYTTTSSSGYFSRIGDLSREKWVLKLGELTHTSLEVKVIEESKLPVMFAGSSIPDVVGSNGTPTSTIMSGSVEAGVFMPIDDLLKQYAPNLLKNVPKDAWEAVSYNGKTYGIPTYLTNPSRRATFIRSDLLEKAGLKPPQTVEEFLDVLRAFKKMGVEHPYLMRENLKYADIILGAYDVLPYRDQFEVVNGQVVPKFFDVGHMEKALETYKTMLDEGLIAKDFATISSADFISYIRSGKAGIWSSNAIGLVDFRTSIKQAVPSARVDIIPSPKGPEGTGGYFHYTPVISAFYINKNVKPETAARIIQFFDWMQTPEAERFFTFGIEGDTYTIVNGRIQYQFPQTKEAIEEEGWRSGTLWGAHDAVANRMRLQLDQNGRDTLFALDHIVKHEGLPGIGFNPDLISFAKYQDLAPITQDGAPRLIMDHIIKMIYGKEPITDWPKVIQEYRQKGGEEIIKEATERYNRREGIVNLYKTRL
ncbi:extracellular solute-binding protein [Paenibacillus sp. OAS669]|uniref:extracellular solute-binding protein n=1 Tax=Paenibacillus sp. OAS669 TaxID=2663821 RepID=UPI001789F3B5|nr:extracellular solute-binding protein [Paenibacillus sp. OAS669]MBE1441449.1 putative aldouronate transport system substrate-binding protein [Paenibacillus sp. OAS669]